MVITTNIFSESELYEKHFAEFPTLKLSYFQKWAIKAIVDGDHSLITAHTGSGKTLPAEFAIKYFVKQGKKVIYTTPVKALSNTKLHDLRKKYPEISFGIITGDISENPDADVLIMTTEILPATILAQRGNTNTTETDPGADKCVPLAFEMDFKNDLAAVVFDEVHYINDPDRGHVWEQAIMLLPPHVQLIMLSATIDKPEIFANWVETEKNKQATQQQLPEKTLYLSSTNNRCVPLIHYAWLGAGSRSTKELEKKKVKWLSVVQKPICIKSHNQTFNEREYKKVVDGAVYLANPRNNGISKKKAFNDLLDYLHKNDGLPAICFVFSKKQVEQLAGQIERPLFDEDDVTTQATIAKDAEAIIRKKLPNYKDYLELPEYTRMIKWFEKGIAIHHAGVLPIFREMVEILFDNKKLKLIIATETLAVGVNFSTKSVIFTSLTKYDGTTHRALLPHEYTQMAGRAGRRGIDKLGKVWLLTNVMREMPTSATMSNILTGSPQTLTSHFKISYPLAIAAFGNAIGETLGSFVCGSMLDTNMKKQAHIYKEEVSELKDIIEQQQKLLEWCNTDKNIIERYCSMKASISTKSNKQKKQYLKELARIRDEHMYIEEDALVYNKLEKEIIKCEAHSQKINYTENYTQYLANRTCDALLSENIIRVENDIHVLTDQAKIAIRLHEVHPLAVSKIIVDTNYLNDLTASEIAALLSCFTTTSMSQDDRNYYPHTNIKTLDEYSTKLAELVYKYEEFENKWDLNTGSIKDIHYEMQIPVLEWCSVADNDHAKNILTSIYDAGMTSGEFVKALLKINNTATELSRACEELQQYDLLQKLADIPALLLKSIVTADSLYI